MPGYINEHMFVNDWRRISIQKGHVKVISNNLIYCSLSLKAEQKPKAEFDSIPL